jgi:hypothetical protein
MTGGPPRHSDRIAVVGGGIGGLAAGSPIIIFPTGRSSRPGTRRSRGEDPLSHNDWLYGYDAERAATAELPAG